MGGTWSKGTLILGGRGANQVSPNDVISNGRFFKLPSENNFCSAAPPRERNRINTIK